MAVLVGFEKNGKNVYSIVNDGKIYASNEHGDVLNEKIPLVGYNECGNEDLKALANLIVSELSVGGSVKFAGYPVG